MSRKKFIPPTLQEAEDYAKEIGFVGFDAGEFIDKNESVGWVDKNGNPYKSWKAVIRMWKRWAGQYPKPQKETKKIKLFPISGKICSKDKCGMPAVYKDTGGAYDYYFCEEHMPAKVKEKYS